MCVRCGDSEQGSYPVAGGRFLGFRRVIDTPPIRECAFDE
jgi:hypothetical protein